MSSFLHSSIQFNSVEKSLIELISNRNNLYHLPYSLKDILVCNDTETIRLEITDFMNCIRYISCSCTNLQYKDAEGYGYNAIDTDYTNLLSDVKSVVKLSNIDLFKALQSINYQIEIEHLEELRPLSKKESASMLILNELIQSIAMYIVSSTKEYNDSKGWSL